jgi:hypothetical protein
VLPGTVNEFQVTPLSFETVTPLVPTGLVVPHEELGK